MPDTEHANAAATMLTTSTTDSLSDSLGVAVEAVAAESTLQAFPAPTPAPSLEDPNNNLAASSGKAAIGGTIAGVVLGGGLLVCLGCTLWRVHGYRAKVHGSAAARAVAAMRAQSSMRTNEMLQLLRAKMSGKGTLPSEVDAGAVVLRDDENGNTMASQI